MQQNKGYKLYTQIYTDGHIKWIIVLLKFGPIIKACVNVHQVIWQHNTTETKEKKRVRRFVSDVLTVSDCMWRIDWCPDLHFDLIPLKYSRSSEVSVICSTSCTFSENLREILTPSKPSDLFNFFSKKCHFSQINYSGTHCSPNTEA